MSGWPSATLPPHNAQEGHDGQDRMYRRSTRERRSVDPEADEAQLPATEDGHDRILTRARARCGSTGRPSACVPSNSIGPQETDGAGRAGTHRWRAAGSRDAAPSQVDHPARRSGTSEAEFPESPVGTGVHKLRRPEDIPTGSRSHGARRHRYGSCGAIGRDVGDLATGIRVYAPAVHLRIYAGRSPRSRPICGNTEISCRKMRLIRWNTRMGRSGSQSTCWATEIGRTSQLIATLARRPRELRQSEP